jgi:hypothetical protein
MFEAKYIKVQVGHGLGFANWCSRLFREEWYSEYHYSFLVFLWIYDYDARWLTVGIKQNCQIFKEKK